MGADLNTWHDPIDLAVPSPDDPYFEEHAFVGANPEHELVDSYRVLLENTGELARRRGQDRSEGPLAVSYTLSNGAQHRMDRIFASREFTPVDAGYVYEEAQECGSDHALHWVDFA